MNGEAVFILAPSCVSGHGTQLCLTACSMEWSRQLQPAGFGEAQELLNSGHGLLVSSLCFNLQGVLSLGRL